MADFGAFAFPTAHYDLVNAQYALPFIKPDLFAQVFQHMLDSLKVGGVFAGQLFGERDTWATTETMTFHTRSEVEELFRPLDVLVFEEEETDGPTALGAMKHWHVFHVIARKK